MGMFSHLISSEHSKLISLVGSPSRVCVYEVLQRCIHRPIFVLLVAWMNLRLAIGIIQCVYRVSIDADMLSAVLRNLGGSWQRIQVPLHARRCLPACGAFFFYVVVLFVNPISVRL